MAALASVSGDSITKAQELESRPGFSFPASMRTALIDAVTDESQGITGAVHKFLSQKYLTSLPKDQQTYITAILPFLQGTAHLMAGARMPATTMRADLESVIPLNLSNPEAMRTMNQTRQNYLNAMDVGSGSAGEAPQFARTIGARRNAAEADASLPTLTPAQASAAPKGTRFRGTDGQIRVRH